MVKVYSGFNMVKKNPFKQNNYNFGSVWFVDDRHIGIETSALNVPGCKEGLSPSLFAALIGIAVIFIVTARAIIIGTIAIIIITI